MTDNEIRIAIAEARGWYRLDDQFWAPKGWVYGKDVYGKLKLVEDLPDYPNDLNAMHEAWNSLKDYNKREFHVQLGLVIEKQNKNWNDLQLLDQRGLITNATARQRAEAFLRTLNPWREEK